MHARHLLLPDCQGSPSLPPPQLTGIGLLHHLLWLCVLAPRPLVGLSGQRQNPEKPGFSFLRASRLYPSPLTHPPTHKHTYHPQTLIPHPPHLRLRRSQSPLSADLTQPHSSSCHSPGFSPPADIAIPRLHPECGTAPPSL